MHDWDGPIFIFLTLKYLGKRCNYIIMDNNFIIKVKKTNILTDTSSYLYIAYNM